MCRTGVDLVQGKNIDGDVSEMKDFLKDTWITGIAE